MYALVTIAKALRNAGAPRKFHDFQIYGVQVIEF